MEQRKERLPRKIKKAMAGLQILPDDGHVIYNWWFKKRRYPHTKWVIRAKREFRRLWRESKIKERKIAELQREIKDLETCLGTMKGLIYTTGLYNK